MTGLRVLAVDHEPPALAEVAVLLRTDPRIADVDEAGTAGQALARLERGALDAVFLDIAMPGLDGLAVARLLPRFTPTPALVFVTAHEDGAVAAFEARAVDYVLKPVRADRLAEAVRRVVSAGRPDPAGTSVPPDETLTVEVGSRVRFLTRSSVWYAEAHGDYVRLHTRTESFLLRVTLAALEERWRAAGFLRVHRSFLVYLGAVTELRSSSGHVQVAVGERVLPVSRRNAAELRDALVRRARGTRIVTRRGP